MAKHMKHSRLNLAAPDSFSVSLERVLQMDIAAFFTTGSLTLFRQVDLSTEQPA